MKNFSYDMMQGHTQHKLSAILGSDSFFYGVFDTNGILRKCHFYENVSYHDPAFVQKIKEELSLYQSIEQIISWNTKPYLHLPEVDGELVQFYPAFDDKLMQHEGLGKDDATVMYGLKASISRFVAEVFTNPTQHHISTILRQSSTPDTVLAYVDEGTLHLTVADDQKLLYYNQFRCKTKVDHLYFIMMVYELMGFDADQTPLHIIGRLESDSEIHQLLDGYIRNISYISSSSDYIPESAHASYPHVYMDLLSTVLCES